MEALHNLIKADKMRALGASAMYGYQFFNIQLAAEKNGWKPFVSIQNHYNLLYCEYELELIPICRQYNVSLTPYSPLADGRLSRMDWQANTLRSKTDQFAMSKYDNTQKIDTSIVMRVHEVADKYNVTMTQIALAWQFAKGVSAPIIGVTKIKYLDDTVGALNVKLTKEDIIYLDELYEPHRIVGS